MQKYQKSKTEKTERVFYELMEKSKMDSQGYFREMQSGYLFQQMQHEKM